MRTESEFVRNLLADGKIWSYKDILDAMKKNFGRVNRLHSLEGLWQRGEILASSIQYFYYPTQKNGKYLWFRTRCRYYVLRKKGIKEKILPISFQSWSKKHHGVLKVQKNVTFTTYENAKITSREKIGEKILNLLKHSKIALFSNEISEKLAWSTPGDKNSYQDKTEKSINHLLHLGKIHREGYFDQIRGKNIRFDRGYLYFFNTEQYDQRLKCHNVFEGEKQAAYNKIQINTKNFRRFTPQSELQFPLNSYERDSLLIVYRDIKKVETSGEVFYYLDGILNEKEIEKQKEYWAWKRSEENSFNNGIGHAHEDFFKFGLDSIWNSELLKIQEMAWKFRISNGKKLYTLFIPSKKEPKKRHEIDRVLYCRLSPFSNEKSVKEIVFVFEAKYMRQPRKKDWEEFIDKLADTYEFGTNVEAKTIDGQIVTIRTVKRNVIPVFIMPWQGENNIEIYNGKVSLAEFISREGGFVIFTSEFEKHFSEKTGKRIKFIQLFKQFRSEDTKKDFATYAVEQIFGNDASKNLIELHDPIEVIVQDSNVKPEANDLKFGNFIRPMLANFYTEYLQEFPVYVEAKINGKRLQLHLNKEEKLVIAYTRSGKWKKIKFEEKLFDEIKCNKCILDCEFLKDRFHVFDILFLEEKFLLEKSYSERRKVLESVLSKDNEILLLVPNFLAKDRTEVKEYFSSFLKMGYEGVMIKNISSVYNPGSRTANWLKWKQIRTIDTFVHKVYRDESLKFRKWMHELAILKDGKPLTICKYPSVEKIEENKVVEVEYREVTNGGKIRHIKNIKIRGDKDASQVDSFENLMKSSI